MKVPLLVVYSFISISIKIHLPVLFWISRRIRLANHQINIRMAKIKGQKGDGATGTWPNLSHN